MRSSKLFLAVPILLILLTITVFAIQNGLQEVPEQTEETEKPHSVEIIGDDRIFTDAEFRNHQSHSIAVYNAILASFPTQDGNIVYPDYYGCAYVDEETGYLIVTVTDVEAAKEALEKWQDSIYRFEQCRYSYNQLLEAHHAVSENVPALSEQGIQIRMILDYAKEGYVLVLVENLDEKAETAIRAIVGYDDILKLQSVDPSQLYP